MLLWMTGWEMSKIPLDEGSKVMHIVGSHLAKLVTLAEECTSRPVANSLE